jgi:hypothetical protein
MTFSADINSFVTVIFTEQSLPNMTEKLWMPQRPEKPFEGKYINVTHTFNNPLVSTGYFGELVPVKNITISYMCFLAKVPSY